MLIFLIILATVLATTLGGLFAVRYKDKLHLILGFSAGAVLGVALFDLLPEATNLVSQKFPVEFTFLLAGIGFSFYMVLDRFLSIHGHDEAGCENPHHQRGKVGAAALSLHSFLDGLGIGLAFKVSPAIGWVVALGVVTHDFSDGINTVNMILKEQGSRISALRWLAIDALTPAVGVAAAFLIPITESNLGLLLAFFAGMFIYIGASDLIPESHHKHSTIWTTVLTILGMAVIYFAVRLAG